MMIVMNMSTGKFDKLTTEGAAEEFGAFVDEVLNSGWLPQPVERLALHEHPAGKPARPAVDADEFLRDLYRNQE